MNRPCRKPWKLIAAIFEAGFRAILLCMIIEIVLLVVATVVGVAVWMGQGFLAGLIAGLVSFAFGQIIAGLIMDLAIHLPERSEPASTLPSDKEELDALRAELGSTSLPAESRAQR